MFCNAQSIRRKWPQLIAAVSLQNPTVLAITETWLSDDIACLYKYGNYSQFAVCRQSVGGGGGVMMLFHPNMSVVKVRTSVVPPPSCDALAVVDIKDGHCWVLVYRPPDCNACDSTQLCEYLDCLLTTYKSVTIIGDFNMSHIKWFNSDNQHLSSVERNFLSFCASWDLQQLVPKPTRGNNYLDLVLTTHPERFGDVNVVSPLVKSDHDAVICQMSSMANIGHVRLVRSFYSADYGAMANYLSLCKWQEILKGCISVNDYWAALYSVLSELVDKFVPTTVKRESGAYHQRLPRPVRKMLLSKRKAWRRWKANPNVSTKANFNAATRRCRLVIRRYLAAEENQLLTAGPRKFFARVSQQLHPSENSIVL